MQYLLEFFKDAKIAVLFDETTDVKQRSVINILFAKLDLLCSFDKPVLIETIFVDSANHSTVSQAVMKAITSMQINLQDVYAIVTDNVAYNLKAFKDLLKPLMRGYFEAPQRKQRFFDLLKNSGVSKPTYFPAPIVTRWNTWFVAVKYISKHFSFLREFIFSELENNEYHLKLSKLKNIIENNDCIFQLFQMVSKHSDLFYFTLLECEKNNTSNSNLFSLIADMYVTIKENACKDVNVNNFVEVKAKSLFNISKEKLE